MIGLLEATTSINTTGSSSSSQPRGNSSSPGRGTVSGGVLLNGNDPARIGRLLIFGFIGCVILTFAAAASGVLYRGGGAEADGHFWQWRSSDPRHDSSHRILAEPQKPAEHLDRGANAQEQQGQPQEVNIKQVADVSKSRNGTNDSKNNRSNASDDASSVSVVGEIYVDWILHEGVIRMRMRPDVAPKTVANILRLVKNGHYNRTGCVYRYEPGFVLQAGLCSKSDGKTVPLEYKLPNKKMTVAIARSSNPHSGGSEWFINLADNSRGLGPSHKGGYAVFAEVVPTLETLKTIQALKKHPTHSTAGKDPKTGRRKRGGLMLFNKPVPHFLGAVIVRGGSNETSRR